MGCGWLEDVEAYEEISRKTYDYPEIALEDNTSFDNINGSFPEQVYIKTLTQINGEIKKIKKHTVEIVDIDIAAADNFIDCKNTVKKYFDDIAELLEAQDDLFFGINRYLENNYGNSELRLPILAEHFYMSKRIISKIILANTNMHFKEYLNVLE